METITDYITGAQVKATDEEINVQALARWFVAIGYRKDQIQTHPQYGVKSPGLRSSTRWSHVDLAVFDGAERCDEQILIIAECKRDFRNDGLNQLRNYLSVTPAKVGLLFNGVDLTYMFHLPKVGDKIKSLPSGDSPAYHFADYLRRLRESRQQEHGRTFSLRQVAARTNIEPTYLSKIECGKLPPPSEEVLLSLARELNEEPTAMLLRAGRLPPDLKAAGLLRPNVLAPLLNALKDAPDEALIKMVRQIRDGKW